MYSLLDGMNKIKELVRKCKELGQTALAITDHGVMSGCVDFYNVCKKEGIKPIIGCEMYVAPGRMTDRQETDGERYYHLVLLCKNETGYRNLCKLVTRSNKDGFYYKPRIDYELLTELHEGLVCLSACLKGEIPQLILQGRYDKAKETAEKYQALFGEDFYLEIQNHGISEEAEVVQNLVRMSSETGIELVCTNDIHYLNSEDAEAHEWLLCAQRGKTINDETRLRYPGDYSVLSEEQMRELFPALPEACDNTAKIAEKCNFDFTFAKSPSQYRMPKVIIPEKWGTDYFGYLESEAWAGYEIRYPVGSKYREEAKTRLEYELSVVKMMGFAEYFLDTRKTVLEARRRNILVGPGRGSGAGSLMNYCLSITDICPLRYGLLFERFLNPERVSMPDIDVDYCYAHREEIIAFERDSNGADKFCKIQTLMSLLPKGVLKSCARVAGYPVSVGVNLAKMIPDEIGITLDKAYEMNPDIKDYLATDPGLEKLWSIAKKMEGLKTTPSTHACGHIPTPVPCEELFPCSYTEDGYLVCQYNMAEIESLGNLKKDLLMLRNLTIIEEAHAAIEKRYGVKVPNWTDEILNDPKALLLIAEGDTNGIFQLESSGMKDFMKQLRPDCFEDIIAGVSLYRPGPMDFIPEYISGKKNPAGIKYLTPLLKPILSPTYGVIVYQEQVMRICTDLAGFTTGHADIIRKAMSKKKEDVMQAEKPAFIEGCKEHGVSEEIADEIWGKMASFAKYAFNKSHAACYSQITMQTAYLKAHYPTEFYAGLLSSVMDSPEKLAKYIADCKSKGIRIRKPDIQTSGVDFSSNDDGSLTFGLASIKGVGEGVIKDIVAARNESPINGMCDLIRRVSSITKGVLESLINAGAFDSLNGGRYSRKTYLENIESSLSLRKDEKRQIEGQLSFEDLFSSCSNDSAISGDSFTNLKEMDKQELLMKEKEYLGFYLSGHPLENFSYISTGNLNAASFQPVEEGFASEVSDKMTVRLKGMVSNLKKKYTKDQRLMCSFTLDDETGSVECVCFAKNYAKQSANIAEGTIAVIEGTAHLEDDEGNYSIFVESVNPISTSSIVTYIRFQTMDDYSRAEEELNRMIESESTYKKDIYNIVIASTNQMKRIIGVSDILRYTAIVSAFGRENVVAKM